VYGIIYKVTGPTGLVYIGQTKQTLGRRKSIHAFRAKKGDRRGAFQIALLALDFSAFEWEQIDTAEMKEELDAKEKYWIAHYQSNNPAHGYNGTDGGAKTVYTIEARRRISEAVKKAIAVIPEETRRRMVEKRKETMKGRHLTPEHKRNISKALKGIKRTPEICKKMSLTQKGRIVSEETRRKMSASARHRSKRGV
jgi:group I intron endonuclease